MNFFLDTEFIEAGPSRPLELLSIGIVTEDGQEYYAEVVDADTTYCSNWVKQNVIPNFTGPKKTRTEIKSDVLLFAPPMVQPVFWGYFADYDWVLFAQLFGRMIDLPKGYPYYCMDLKQYAEMIGVPGKAFPPQASTAHNALNDAKWNLELYKFLRSQS